MANMELITSVTVGSGGAASVTLPATGTIPQTYTDLKIVYSVRSDNTNPSNTIDISFNGNTTGFTNRYLIGTGSGTASGSNFGRYAGSQNSANETASTFSNGDIYIPNYTNTSINKSYSSDGVYENNATGAGQGLVAGLWSNTAAITTITLTGYAGNFVQGSTFYLYGISNVTSGTKATGGVVSSDGTYYYHMFPFSGTFTPTQNITADYLVIAGGGAGGPAYYGGGGGAGGLRSTVGATGGGGSLESALSLTANTAYTVTVGAGGAGGTDAYTSRGAAGSNSVFSSITSTGGGGGGTFYTAVQINGGDGGSSGGGGSGTGVAGTRTASPVQGYNGGNASYVNSVYNAGGGGGGAGAAGANSTTSPQVAGNGGNGVQITAFANATQTGLDSGYYAGGGGGGFGKDGGASGGTAGTGGLGGGGAGSTNGFAGSSAPANTGGGGGGAGGYANKNGSGGSGLVIIRYAI